MLIEKEVIAPGTYWYEDQKTGLPRKLEVTPKETRYWCDQGQAMLGAGLQVPVPYEHDFSAHPMTPKDKLLNNAGEVREYRLKDFNDPVRGLVKDALFSVVEIQDEQLKPKVGNAVRWTSPWFNSFTDGQGKRWDNVIAHLALTTRPRIVKQQPFKSAQAALSLATPTVIDLERGTGLPPEGICLSKAGLLGRRKMSKRLEPRFPVAFSIYSGAALGDDFPPKKSKGPPKPPGGDKTGADGKPAPGGTDDSDMDGFDDESGKPSDGDPSNDGNIDLAPYGDPKGDVQIEEVLCDLLRALGVNCEHTGDEATFKRSLYTGAMQKIHELASKGQNPDQMQPGKITDPNKPGGPAKPGQPNPMVQQEQQPMYMSLEEINAISDPTMKSVALSMYNNEVKLRAEMEADRKKLQAQIDKTIRVEDEKRKQRVAMLGRRSPKVKADLDAMLALPGMALSMGDDGNVVDPMAQTLDVLEKGLASLPDLLTADSGALSVQPQPRDGSEMTQEEVDSMVEVFARAGGIPPEQKRAS